MIRKVPLLLTEVKLSDTKVKFCVCHGFARGQFMDAYHTKVLSESNSTHMLQYASELTADNVFIYRN